MSPSTDTGPARIAREELADSLARTAPDAPTLCTGWDASRLAAHVVLRDTRPDVAAGTVLSAFSPLARGWVARQLDALVAQTSYPELVERVRRGPVVSPTRIRVIDDAVNTGEFAVHRADVDRARPGWEAVGASTSPLVQRALWSNLRTGGRLIARSVPGPLVVATPDGRRARLRSGEGDDVVLTGSPMEIVLFLFGRDSVARVELTGPPGQVRAVRDAKRRA